MLEIFAGHDPRPSRGVEHVPPQIFKTLHPSAAKRIGTQQGSHGQNLAWTGAICSVKAFEIISFPFPARQTCTVTTPNPQPLGYRAKREYLNGFWGLPTESSGYNLAVTVLYVPYSLHRGQNRAPLGTEKWHRAPGARLLRRPLPVGREAAPGPSWDGPASGENTSHSCRLRILGYFGLDPPKRGSASGGISSVLT